MQSFKAEEMITHLRKGLFTLGEIYQDSFPLRVIFFFHYASHYAYLLCNGSGFLDAGTVLQWDPGTVPWYSQCRQDLGGRDAHSIWPTAV